MRRHSDSPRDRAGVGRHWLSRERLALYCAAFLALTVATGVLILRESPGGADRQGNPRAQDFIVFWSASQLALSGQAVAAYDGAAIGAVERRAVPAAWRSANTWQYPPTFLLLVLPLALLPYLSSYLMFMGSTLLAYLGVVRGTALALGIGAQDLWLPLLAFPAVFLNLHQGQNGFLTAALGGGGLLLLRTRPAAAGLLFGLLVIKPHLGLLLPLALACGRHWRALGCAALSGAAFTLLSLAVLGNETLYAFLDRLSAVNRVLQGDSLMLVREMTSFYSFARLLGLPPAAATAVHWGVAAGVAGAVGWLWWRRLEPALCAAALLVGSLLISPYVFDYDLCWLAPAMTWFAGYALRQGWRPGEREVLVLVWLTPVLWLPVYHFFGLQLAPLPLLALFLLILRRASDGVRAAAP